MKELREARAGKRASRAKPVENVLREGLRLARIPDPSTVVLFGATGDLAHRKVIPALYQLWRTDLLPHEFQVLAIGRREYDDSSFRAEIHASLEKYSRMLPLDEDAWQSFSERITYQRLRFRGSGRVRRPCGQLETLDAQFGTRGNRLLYLATQPSQFADIVAQLGRVGLDHERHDGGWRRIVIEKPFGHDRDSARRLNREVAKTFASRRSIGSTTTSARRPSATCWSSASATASSSRCGTDAMSITCRSRWRSRSVSRTAGRSTSRPGR